MSPLVAVIAAWAVVPLAPVATRLAGRFAGWPLALVLMAPLALVVGSYRPGEVSTASVPWIPAIDVALRLRLDGLGLLFSLLVLGIGAIVLIYSSSYLRAPRSPGFYLLMTAFAASMLTLVLADDLLVLFISWEFTTLCSYLLILRSGPQAKGPATRTLLVTVAGGLSLLAAVATIIAVTGTTHLSAALSHEAWTSNPTFATVVALLVVMAAMTKSAQFPFHSWLPDAMVAPAPVSAYLHAAAMVKAGIYLLMLFAPAASHAAVWPVVLIGVGLLTSVMGGVIAVFRTDIKSLMAYSTVSQLGLMVAVIGVGTDAALMAASVHVVAHALFKASGFMAVGMIEKRTGTRELGELHGLWRAMPLEVVLVGLAMASMAAVIPLFGFVSKELILEAFLHSPFGTGISWLLAIIVAVGAAFTVAYSARVLLPTVGGEPMEVKRRREYAAMTGTVGLTALAGLVLGPLPALVEPITAPAARSSSPAGGEQIPYLSLWHGINPALILSLLSLAGGLTLAVWLGRHLAAGGTIRRSRLDGARIVQDMHDGVIALGNRVGALTRFDSTAGQLAVPLVLIGLSVLATPFLWQGMPGFHAAVNLYDVLLMVVIAVGLYAVTTAARRLTAVVSAGIIGFGVVLWFFLLGASDVALTQLTVEVLTVVAMVLVLTRMSTRFPREGRPRAIRAGVIAVLVGAAATVATLTFTGHRDLSPVGEYFMAEAEGLTGGTNIVNTILVDFRALDTLGEMVVLALAAVSITALLQARRPIDGPPARTPARALADPLVNSMFLRVLARVILPAMVAVSALALLRGHNATGGGFIAALIGAAVIVYVFLASPTDRVKALEKSYLALAGSGILVAVITGLVGLAEGSVLRPLHADILGYHFTTALVFDLGVYLAVLGVILGAVNQLGVKNAPEDETEDAPEDTPEGEITDAPEDEEVTTR